MLVIVFVFVVVYKLAYLLIENADDSDPNPDLKSPEGWEVKAVTIPLVVREEEARKTKKKTKRREKEGRKGEEDMEEEEEEEEEEEDLTKIG